MNWRVWKIILIACVLTAGVFLVACTGRRALPEDAWEALLAYWDSLPSDPAIDHNVVRSWPGEISQESEIELEVWCVESDIVAPGNTELNGESLKWILFRAPGDSEWSVALLATMSSMWPYEACGQAPGS